MFFVPFGTKINDVKELSNFITAKSYEIKESSYGLIGGLKWVYVEISSLIGFSSISSRRYTVYLKPLETGYEVMKVLRE